MTVPLLQQSPSQESAGPTRFVSPAPPTPASRASTATIGPTTAMVPRPGTSQTAQPERERRSMSQSGTYWGPLPESYANESYGFRRPENIHRNSYNEYESMNRPQMTIENEEPREMEPTPRPLKQASVDPFPTNVQTIPSNPEHHIQTGHLPIGRRPSDSFRSLRYDTKKRSYRFDNLPDIESESGRTRGPGSYYDNGRSTPVEEILRLPLTWWMNSSTKNRKLTSGYHNTKQC